MQNNIKKTLHENKILKECLFQMQEANKHLIKVIEQLEERIKTNDQPINEK